MPWRCARRRPKSGVPVARAAFSMTLSTLRAVIRLSGSPTAAGSIPASPSSSQGSAPRSSTSSLNPWREDPRIDDMSPSVKKLSSAVKTA